MFSVKSKKKASPADESSLIFSAGINTTNFTYTGSTDPTYTGVTEQFAFNTPTYFIHGQFGMVHLHFDYGNKLGPDELLRYANVSLTFEGGILITRTRKFQIFLPLHLITDSFTISSQAVIADINRFEQTGFSFGTGAQGVFQPTPWLNLRLSQLVYYGFSSRGLGSDYGSKLLLESKADLITFQVFKDSRLSFHTAYRYHEYDLDDFLFDYNMNAFTFGLGLTF
jgi:hypothetical protein